MVCSGRSSQQRPTAGSETGQRGQRSGMRKRRSYEIRGARPTRCGAAKPLIMAALADAEGAHDSNHHLQCTSQAQPWQVPENGK